VLILARQDEALAHPRLGITASRKIGGAVVRNRAKRLVREAFRAQKGLVPPGVDLVVIVKKSLGELGLAEVVAEWRGAGDKVAQRVARVLARPAQPRNTGGRG
jgi:ribonuclease P protein component